MNSASTKGARSPSVVAAGSESRAVSTAMTPRNTSSVSRAGDWRAIASIASRTADRAPGSSLATSSPLVRSRARTTRETYCATGASPISATRRAPRERPGTTGRTPAANSYLRTQLVRCTLRVRRGGTSSRPHQEGVGAGRGGGGSSVTAGAWVTGGPVWGPGASPSALPPTGHPGELVPPHPTRTVHATSSAWRYELAGVPHVRLASVAGPGERGWAVGREARRDRRPSAPARALPANSYLRTQLVRCTLRARHGRTSLLPAPEGAGLDSVVAVASC